MKTLTWNEFVENVQAWAKERGIYEHSTPQAQLLKTLSELGEVADAIIKNDRNGLIDGIGDVAVCLVNYARMIDEPVTEDGAKGLMMCFVCPIETVGFLVTDVGYLITDQAEIEINMAMAALWRLSALCELDFFECLTRAWNEIKDRKGKMVEGGAFVKDE